jgi:phage terminase small subunit
VKLTPKQEKFVQGLISGLSQREAFKQAYDCKNMKDTTIDARASKLFKEYKVSTRYDELMEEHKNKALWTREESINDLKWLKEQAKLDIETIGVKQANSNAFLNAVKELNELEDLYPKKAKEDTQQEKDVAEALRGLVNGINSKAD